MFFDVGGSMDHHVELCAQLFSAVSGEFKYLEYFYFHNFFYGSVWRSNERRKEEALFIRDLIRKEKFQSKVIDDRRCLFL